MTPPDAGKPANVKPLKKALAKNVEAKETVQRAADGLTIVRAVLEKLPEGTPPEDIDLAANHTGSIKEELASAAEKLKEVNDTLAEELKAGQASNR